MHYVEMDVTGRESGERRKHERRQIELPIVVTAIDGIPADLKAVTRNISSGGGVCFDCRETFPVDSSIEYAVTLSSGSVPVMIACAGRVLRCLPAGAGIHEIALTMDTYRFVSPVST